MDILSSLGTAEPTRLCTGSWLPADDSLAPRDGSTAWTVDSWSNYTVLLLARAENLLCRCRKASNQIPSQSLVDDWNALRYRIETHERRQPWQFRPLCFLEADPESEENPFPVVRYPSEAISASTQLFDLTRFLAILARPERNRRERAARFESESKILMTYVRRVVGNSVVNRREVNWVCAVHLLSSAGLALVPWRERKALIRCLDDIHILTGWNTLENMNGLLDRWGWSEPLRDLGQTWKDVKCEIGPYATPAEWLMSTFDNGTLVSPLRTKRRL